MSGTERDRQSFCGVERLRDRWPLSWVGWRVPVRPSIAANIGSCGCSHYRGHRRALGQRVAFAGIIRGGDAPAPCGRASRCQVGRAVCGSRGSYPGPNARAFSLVCSYGGCGAKSTLAMGAAARHRFFGLCAGSGPQVMTRQRHSNRDGPHVYGFDDTEYATAVHE
jgi:hypothetical protein|eukprot:SAG25_NODE_15_length_24441_cov_175.207288_18_plen_166_part_00